MRPVFGTAPEVFAGLPAPDAIFVGGNGGEVARLLEACFAALRPGGRLVTNVGTLEMLSATYAALKRLARPRRCAADEPLPRRGAAGIAALRGGQPDGVAAGGESLIGLDEQNHHFATSAPGHTRSLNRSTGSFAVQAMPRRSSTRNSGSSNVHE